MPVPRADLAGMATAHTRLLDDLAGLADSDMAAPSLLPDWTVGHVLTHLARNADGYIRMVMAAVEGDTAPMYPSVEDRAAGIESGAGRPAREQLEDLRRSIEDLAAAFGRVPPEVWQHGVGLVLRGELRVADMPFRRWREVEVHHADLGRSSFTYDDWSEAYVERELAETMGALLVRLPDGVALRIDFEDVPDVVVVGEGAAVPVVGTRRQVLAWLTGRADRPDLPALGPWF
jgi:maleylpyruvate isomerase